MRKQDVSGSISKIIEIIGIDPDVWNKYSGKMLMSIGLDSVDVAKLRAIIQPKPSFQKLYGMRLSDIADMVVDTTASEQPNGEQKHGGSVALTPMQESYLYGDKQGTPCIVYSEFSLKNVDINTLISSIDHVILQEPMLHACIHNDTSQTIKPEHERQGISGKKIEDIVDYGEFRRSLMDNLISSEDRHWEVCLTKGSQGLTLHVAIDMLFMDAASAVLLAKRVAKTYEDLLGGSSLNLTPTEPPIFFDYAQRFSTPVMFDKVSEEEKEKVKGFPGPPQLPRKKHDSLPTPSFSRESGALSEKHWDKIKELAQIHSVTSNAIMLAAFSETLSLFAENPDFTITVTCSDRVSLSGHQFDGAIGDFTNVILCPVSTDNQNLLELAKSINTRLIEGIEEDGIGGLDAVRLLRHLNHDPHLNFPIVFTSFLGVVETVALKGADVTLSYQQTQTPQLTLDHQVYESKGKLITNWDFDETIYSSDQISSMLGCFLRVLTKFAEGENSDAALSSSEHALRVEMNQTTEDFEPASPHLLHEIVLAQAKNSPDALAVIDQTVRIPYSELVTLATHTASQLQAKGVLPGDVVGVVHKKGWEQVVSTMAILMVGGVYLPLNPSHPDERLRSILSIAGVKLALVHAATVVGREWQIYENGQEVQCHHVLRDIDVDLSDQFVAESISPSDSAYIIFTSGSTGTPKGVEIAHEGAVNTCLDINHRFSLGTDTVTFGISSLGFDLSVWDIFGTLSAGGTLVMCKPDGTVDPDYWWQQVLEHGVTMWNTVPTSFEMLVQSRPEHVEMPIRSVLLSGDAIRVNMVEEAITAFPSLKVHALGGATEASIWSNYHTVTDSTFDLGTDLVPYGRPLSNQTMMVLDNKLRYRPSGAVGEIHIGGIGVAKGYFKSPELTQKSFIDTEEFGRIYKTGDLGRYLPNGEIEIIGRKDSQVKVGGHRVELAEIEKCAESVNNVSKASVIHIPGAGARLVGFVICNDDDDLVVNAVKTHIQQTLPDYMEPQTWIPVDTIPLTANNKVDAKALRTIANSNVTNEPKEAHTDSELVGQILELAANVLGVSAEHLSSSSNLAEQGLTSLYSVKLINLLSAKVGHRLPYTLIFNYPTANKLAAYLLSESDVAKRSESHSVSPADDPIAVIAVSCRLPGNVSSLDEFCYELEHKYHPVQDVPISRFDIAPFFDPEIGKPGKTYTKVGTFIENIHQFDNSLFQIPLGEAKTMDPQQRMLLEISYEAFLNGGYDLDALSGSDTGVFIGQMNYDWMMDFDHSRQYASTGSAPSISANRISYAFDLIGPSMTVDTACSSSLVSIDLAVSKLRAGECKLAIAGGINLILSPEPYLFTCQARMLSPDGRCATFDENANGIARGEGAGVVLLKRLSDAEKDGDPILGLITGTAVNQDGRSASLTAPNGLSQRKLLDASLSKAGLRGGELDYIECHGTGTALGDPIELEAISQAFSDSRDSALVLGAVKTNLGHLEGAAGIVGFIKSLGVINRRTAPANIHFSTLNPKIDLGNLKAVIPRDSVTLSPGEKGYISAGVSSFGYGGTNAHVTLKSYEGQSKLKTKHKSVWTFSGQGSVTSGAIESLYDHVPVFRENLEYYLGAVGELLGEGNSVIDDLLSVVLNASSSNTEILRDTAIQQPVIVAIQLAQIKMWTEWGVQPSAVLGHSVGELSASVAAGVMTDVDALKLSVARGRLLSECEPGYMVAVKTSLQDLPSPLPGKLEVAVVNSDTQVVLATTDLEDLDRLTSYGFTCHKLSVSHPFHSSFVKLASERFRQHINNIQLSLPDPGIKFISSVTGQVENERWQESRYWVEQITRPVDYASAMRTLSESLIGSEAIIELGANRVLTSLTEELKDKFPRIRSVVSKECVRGLPSLVAFHHKNLLWEPPKIGLTTIPTESARRPQSIKVPNWFERVTWAKKESVNQGSLNGVLIVGHENPWIDPNEQSEFVLFDEFRRVVGSPKPEKPSQFIYIADERSDILKASVEFIQTLQQLDRACEVGVVIRGSQPHQESVAGLFKSACLEIPTACVSILVSEEKELDNALKTVLPLRGECARLDKDGLFWIRTTEPLSLEHEPAREREENGLHVISGGLGGLGKEAIKTLASLGAKYFLVLGTKPMSLISGKLNDLALELNNIEIHYEQCDVSLELDVRQVAQKYRAKYPITGVVHTAGILDDGFVASLTAEQFERPKNVKLIGAQNLYTQFGELDWFVAYSSISSEVGAMGQANYVAANSALDGWIEQLASKGHAVASVRWGVWSQCGMAYERDLVGSLSQLGYGVVNNQDGSSILSALVQYPLSGIFAASPIDRPSFTQRQEPVQLQTAKPESLSFESVQSITPVIWSEEKVSALVTSCLEDFCESEPNDELSFMDAGLSSLDLVQFREKLLAALPESVDIPAQFVFNYPTLKDVTDNLVEQLQDCIDVPSTQSDSDTMVSSITWQKLNDIEGEQAIFLLGGVVGNVEKTFAPLASSLPFPVFATMPEIPWDLDGGRLTLEGLAAQLTESLLQQYPRSRYIIGGLSFGATLSLEMGKLLEQRGLLERVLLLDPRHMDPFKAPVDPAGFETMLSQYSSDFVLNEPVHLMQCDVPAWESQSELMQEASRSFMPDSHIQECCRNRCANITVERVEGHHFNFLYKFKSQTASRISARVLSDAIESLREDIAVIATSSILPGCNDSDSSFWALLEEGKHGIREIPKSRFDIDGRYHPDPNGIGTTYTRHGGFVETAELFDFEWFGISLTEAEVMDPQQRLLLEVTDQALHNAGYPKGSLKGSDTAVFVGLANDDWSAMGRDEYAHSPYFGAGVSSSIASNRISYLMGFKGPSMTIDTACSSSLVALKSAVDTLREGRSKIALVAGANVIAHDRMYISACATNALSRKGRCASFDAQADGYCRGE
ncbi:hybrid non-ribosomal peptide synthetase/type I polyketide synthase, partial [Vibrio nigripulchritudo]